ncbi:hypothetical protein DPEC_G00153470 [Dallia pectoralis]|uniref:Uncharacterized protein n=1 Tax=Dallia pectoralis TaxID=75939 RepID=A0ACC2GJY5_DALPE|nr:hypothetical protein DPEC_G00153470 [Dallia pectoralis]
MTGNAETRLPDWIQNQGRLLAVESEASRLYCEADNSAKYKSYASVLPTPRYPPRDRSACQRLSTCEGGRAGKHAPESPARPRTLSRYRSRRILSGDPTVASIPGSHLFENKKLQDKMGCISGTWQQLIAFHQCWLGRLEAQNPAPDWPVITTHSRLSALDCSEHPRTPQASPIHNPPSDATTPDLLASSSTALITPCLLADGSAVPLPSWGQMKWCRMVCGIELPVYLHRFWVCRDMSGS